MKKSNAWEMKGKESLISRNKSKKKGTSKQWQKHLNVHSLKKKKQLHKNNNKFSSKLKFNKYSALVVDKSLKAWLYLLPNRMKRKKII